MFGSGVGIYMMNKHKAPKEFFEEEAGLKKPRVAVLHVVVVAIRHFVLKNLNSALKCLSNSNIQANFQG
jgi:hypothetical protein